jgi:SNF2 family DNA or RNA helicase
LTRYQRWLSTLDPDNWSFTRLLAQFYEPGADVDGSRITGTPRNLHLLQHRLREAIMVRVQKVELPDLGVPPISHEEFIIANDEPYLTWFVGDGARENPGKLGQRARILAQLHSDKARSNPILKKQLKEQLTLINGQLEKVPGSRPLKVDGVTQYLLEQTEQVVVFAHHLALIDEYADRLRRAGRQVLVLTGRNTKQTQKVVDQFQTDPSIQYSIF